MSMATVPRDARLAQEDGYYSNQRPSDDLFALRASNVTLSPGGRSRLPTTATETQRQRLMSFTTDDLPSTTKPLLQPNFSQRIMNGKLTLTNGLSNINTDTVTKLGAQIVGKGSELVERGAQMVDKVKQSFTEHESERILREDWMIVETEDNELTELKEIIVNLEKAFQFSKSSPLVTLATSTLKRCEALVDRSGVHVEQCQLMFSQCSNEIATLQDYLAKLRDAIEPVAAPREKNEEKKVSRRAEWAVSRMMQSSQSMVSEMREGLEELDELITEGTKLMVQAITLLHIRTRSADFSGTGVAVGAASVVAGALVGAAGIIAAPVTGGLSVPISFAGKGLFFSGVAALTPSTIMLNRHSQQLNGLVKLVEHLKSRLEIMTQKREEMSKAFAACEDLELNVKQAGSFCQDALELEMSPYESVWPFVEPIYGKLATLQVSVTLFLTYPSLWHYCKSEDELHHYLLPEADDE